MLSERIDLSLDVARRLALHTQLLDGATALPGGKEGVARVIEALGYVQIDTISVVQRAHHHALWTRRPDYDPDILHELQAQDRRVFEYWGHAASYLPMSDFRFYIPQMRGHRAPKNKWVRGRLELCGHLMAPIRERIRQEGPLGSKDFEPEPGAERGAWWDWKPAKVALELLFWQGELMITERRGFQRIYDLTERVLPDWVDTRLPDEAELGRFLVRRALQAYGVAQEAEIRDHIRSGSRAIVAAALAELVEVGEVVPVSVEGIEADYFASTERVEWAADLGDAPARVSFLSPFDNLIIQRDRVAQLFGFAYTLECYTPAEKRQFGYYTMPILWGDRLVGRIDPKAERKSRELVVCNLAFEPWFELCDAFLAAFDTALRDLAQFNACERVRFERDMQQEMNVDGR